MKISDKQIMYLLTLLHDTMKHDISGVFSMTHEQRTQLYNEIVHQQSEEPVERESDNSGE